MFDLMKDKHSLQQKPDKLAAVMDGEKHDIRSTWFDFDLNRHVTSSRYVDWMFDHLPVELLVSRYPKSLSINYLKEILPGEVTRLSVSEQGDGNFLLEGVSLEAGKPSFRGKISF